MFIDKAKIFIKAGKGGNGAISFHREKYVAAGGPDGGDGGKGGNVIFKVELGMTTLMDFRYKRKYVAQNGMDGSGKRQKGKKGEDIIIKVLLSMQKQLSFVTVTEYLICLVVLQLQKLSQLWRQVLTSLRYSLQIYTVLRL